MNEAEHHDRHYAEAAKAHGESPLFQRVHDRSARDLLRRIVAARSQRMLSLGCGDGAIERRLAPYFGEIVGLDISAIAIERARGSSAAEGLDNLSFFVANAADESLRELGSFDVVAAFAFLHHLSDERIRRTLAAARASLRAGGVFYSIDPSQRRLVRLFAGCVRAAYNRHHSPDERELDPERLAALAVEAGFAAPVIGYVDFFLGPLAWLAPGIPRWLVGPLVALDDLALRLPLVRRYASSFSLRAAHGDSRVAVTVESGRVGA